MPYKEVVEDECVQQAESFVRAKIASYADSCGGQIRPEDFAAQINEWLAVDSAVLTKGRLWQIAREDGRLLGENPLYIRNLQPVFSPARGKQRVEPRRMPEKKVTIAGDIPLPRREYEVALMVLSWFSRDTPKSLSREEIEKIALRFGITHTYVKSIISRFTNTGLLVKAEGRGYYRGEVELKSSRTKGCA